ncbi:MAG: hypothetical protein ACXWEG_08330 [Actinomycetota bacterium]
MSIDRAADQKSQPVSERRKERLHDPDVQERLRQIHEQIDAGEPLIPGISGEELPDFLREQREQLDT